ncbi:DUF559 domain-containing protein [Saccharopolyspora rhizosphaerae]|uniref:DUF559 domain-containing protein n=1 Tax=Saccharopolyspora rhizosphaerae TaxID=2492662 RepID=A0A426JIS1_9PSEU|nr:DUF559 domain-containing protein [Saccharopolyspora rhizosphaerae]RRO12940.1 DUF559 domain-containing protein [Saccharopolyspora rhizosphaerae]
MDFVADDVERRRPPLFTRAQALAQGISDHKLAKYFTRVLQGVYTVRDAVVIHQLRCRAAAMTLPANAVITGRSAATLLGADLAGPHDPVEVLVSDHKYMNRRFGLRAWARTCTDDELVPWHGIRLARMTRAAFDVLARHTLRFAVANCDAMLRAGLVDETSLHEFIAERHYYGYRKAHRALALVDARAESIPESVLRVELVRAGLTPTPQVEVFDLEGNVVARPDLAFEEEKVAVEHDGNWHARPEQRAKDEVRRQRLRECGWTVVVVTRDDLCGTPGAVVNQVKKALGCGPDRRTSRELRGRPRQRRVRVALVWFFRAASSSFGG